MNRFAKRGFTLAELLVVIAVIALLVAVIMPTLNSAFAYQRYINCAHNLSELGVAYGTMFANRRLNGETGIGALDSGWPKEFEPYVASSQTVFWCPATEGVGNCKQASLDAYYDEVYISGAYQGAMSLSESASPWVWRLSQTQFNVFLSSPGHGQGYNYVGYIPDSNPNLYYYLLEDNAWKGGGDKDFYDIIFKIETDGVNSTITCVVGITGYVHNFYVVKGGVKDIIWADCRKFNGQSVQVKGVGISSYGVNTVADQVLPGSGGKILIMDYDFITAAGSPYDETGGRAQQLAKNWLPDPNNPSNGPRFARHYRKANVLFTDGSVKLMSIADIDPRVLTNCAQFWNPK